MMLDTEYALYADLRGAKMWEGDIAIVPRARRSPRRAAVVGPRPQVTRTRRPLPVAHDYEGDDRDADAAGAYSVSLQLGAADAGARARVVALLARLARVRVPEEPPDE